MKGHDSCREKQGPLSASQEGLLPFGREDTAVHAMPRARTQTLVLQTRGIFHSPIYSVESTAGVCDIPRSFPHPRFPFRRCLSLSSLVCGIYSLSLLAASSPLHPSSSLSPLGGSWSLPHIPSPVLCFQLDEEQLALPGDLGPATQAIE